MPGSAGHGGGLGAVRVSQTKQEHWIWNAREDKWRGVSDLRFSTLEKK